MTEDAERSSHPIEILVDTDGEYAEMAITWCEHLDSMAVYRVLNSAADHLRRNMAAQS